MVNEYFVKEFAEQWTNVFNSNEKNITEIIRLVQKLNLLTTDYFGSPKNELLFNNLEMIRNEIKFFDLLTPNYKLYITKKLKKQWKIMHLKKQWILSVISNETILSFFTSYPIFYQKSSKLIISKVQTHLKQDHQWKEVSAQILCLDLLGNMIVYVLYSEANKLFWNLEESILFVWPLSILSLKYDKK